jgi:hypothetical protein
VPTLDDVYLKFGFASEAAQLLETQLGNLLLASGALEADLFAKPNATRAADLLNFVDRQTLGQLLKSLKKSHEPLDELDLLLKHALSERNRLAHSYYREHNFRRNSEEGRAVMMADLESIHEKILEAYTAVLRIAGFDIHGISTSDLPTRHVPI